MVKKFKPKAPKGPNSSQHDLNTSMMTEQEERMFYANKKFITQQTSHQENYKKGLKQSANYENMDQDDENIEPIQFSNLNQTSAQQITEFINKLIAKNKVTSKNAFDIPLIHLQQMEDFRSSLNQNTWKRLSSTLENDYKIYGYRVDAAHTITYKMVQSIARHEATAEQVMGASRQTLQKNFHGKKQVSLDLLTSLIDVSFNQNVSKSKMNVDYTRFIEKNQKLLNITHIEGYFGCNPGLQKTKRKFDQQGLKALLLNNIALRNGCELKLDEHRKYDVVSDNRAKKQHSQTQGRKQNQLFMDNEVHELFERVFTNKSQADYIVQDNAQYEKSIFEQIHELNVHEDDAGSEEFLKYEKLYKIISGEDREEKKTLLKRKMEEVVQERKDSQMQPEHDNNFIEFQAGNQQQDIQNILPPEIEISQIIKNQNQNPQNPQANHSILPQPKAAKEIGQHLQNTLIKDQQKQSEKLKQSEIISQTKQQKHLDESDNHILRDKNFQMHQLNLENLDESSDINSKQKAQYTGNYKNIEDYIKIKEPRQKLLKKNKLQLDQLSSEQIGKRLFNRKYSKKRGDQCKVLKQEDSMSHVTKKVNFTKILKESADLKRSVVFKKSLAEQRTFTMIRQRIRKKLSDKQKDKIVQQEEETHKKRKGKRLGRLFQFPVYQFERQDVNFINPYQEVDPETNELQFSSLYMSQFPSFVKQAQTISHDIKSKKLSRQRELQQKDNEQRRIQSQLQEQMHNQQQQNDNFVNQQNIEIQYNDGSHQHQPDISYIHDEMGHHGKGHQVAIRDAKDKVRLMILKKFQQLRLKKAKSKKPRQEKISFKKIYQAYYLQQGFISPALCFLTILHLTNEYNFCLEGKEDGNNFKIFVQQENVVSQGLRQENVGGKEMSVDSSMLQRSEMISESLDQSLGSKSILRSIQKSQLLNFIEEE